MKKALIKHATIFTPKPACTLGIGCPVDVVTIGKQTTVIKFDGKTMDISTDRLIFTDCESLIDYILELEYKLGNIAPKKEYYFLFGETICRLYHEGTFKEVLLNASEGGVEFAIHKFVDGEHPENIMEASSGWMDYATITKEEYEQLNEIQED